METNSEPNRNSFQRFPAKPLSLNTQTVLDSCQQHLETFSSTLDKLRIDLLSVIEEYEKLLRGTPLENGVRSFKDTITWIFEPVEDKTLSLSAVVKTAFGELSEIIGQRNRGGKEISPAYASRQSNGNDPVSNCNDTQPIGSTRSYRKISKQEINMHKVRLLQPCVDQLIDLLGFFFQKGHETYSIRELTGPNQSSPVTPSEDLNQLPAFFPSLPQMLQVPTAHWFVASQTSAEIRQQDFRLALSSTTSNDLYIRKQLLEYVQYLDKTPFKRFQVLGGFQCNPNDMCKALERCVTEEELAQINEYYVRRGEAIREGVITCEIPQNTSYVIGDTEINREDGTNKIHHEIDQLCGRLSLEGTDIDTRKRLAELVTCEVCSDMLKKSSYVSVLLLYGKAYLVDIAEILTTGVTNNILISQLDNKLGLKVEEIRRWKVIPSNALEGCNAHIKDPLATIETCYKKDFQLSPTDNTFILETVDVRVLSINHGLEPIKKNISADNSVQNNRHIATQRTYSLPIDNVEFRSNGEREKPQTGHPALQHTMSLHYLDESTKYNREGAGIRTHPSNLANSRSKTGSSESISSVSTLKAINPDFTMSADGVDDVRQQLFQDTTLQHLHTDRFRKWEQLQKPGLNSWPRDDPGTDGSRDFFFDLFYKTNQDLNSPKQKDDKKAVPSPSKDKSPRNHKRNFSVDSSQTTVTGVLPEKHQSVNNLSINPSTSTDNIQAAGEIGKHWSSSLSNDNLTKCNSWPTLCGVLDLDFPAPPSKETGFGTSPPQVKNRGNTKLEDSIDSTHMNTLYEYPLPQETGSKEFHCSDSKLWPSKNIWGDDGLDSIKMTRPPSFSSDSESCTSDSDNKDSYRAKEITRTRYKLNNFSENKPKSKHQYSRPPPPPPFTPANSPQSRPIYHQPSPPPPHWERVDPNGMPPRNPHPPHPPPGWNGNHWHEGAPPMPMPPMHGPHPSGQWGPPPPPPGANMPPHHHPHSHPPHQGPPPHGQQFSYHNPPPPPPPPHYPPPIGLHSTPSPLPTPPESPRPAPPHQVIHPNAQAPPLQHPNQIPSPTPRPNSPIPPNQQYPPYGPPMHHMDPNHPHNQGPPRGPPPYYVHRMPHPHYYPIPNSHW
ncbi:hypothetical protein LOD99_8965 [Oopsacas minuta]|uniref:Uncharacterized protein n=1 Tax=Oopsacas minuta TaxID=111878 RepID=A0AAV7JE67_9METZ|nr:hypothetical protein LOD99_8965 [Oopsacas minuta]